MNSTLWLCITIAAAGLWSGLLLTITTILHPMFAPRDNAGLRDDLGRFLPIARRAPANYVLVIALMIAPVVTLLALWDSSIDGPIVLTATGALLTYVGAFGLSRFAAEPNYDVLLTGDPQQNPTRWSSARHRYFALNWARAGLVWSAFGCFIGAGYLTWR